MSKMTVVMLICCWIAAGAAAAVDGDGKAGAPAGAVKARTFNVLNYGAVGDDKTDNTEAFSACLKAVIAAGGGKMFIPDGIYRGRIIIPGTKEWITVEIAGESEPTPVFRTIGSFPFPKNGTIIKCLSESGPAVISSANVPEKLYDRFSGVNVSLRNLDVRTYNNPGIGGIDLLNAVQCKLENVFVNTDIYNVQASKPTRGTAGISTPACNNGALTILRNVMVTGYHTGILVNEHTDGDNIVVASNVNGLEFVTNHHASRFGRVGTYRNAHHVTVSGRHGFSIEQMNTEQPGPGQTDTNNAWQTLVSDINDPKNLGFGDINYWVVEGNVGAVGKFTRNGGASIRARRIGAAPAGAAKQASGQESKGILELEKYKGATAISPLLFGHNLETTRRGVWQGLGAERVANRKFAADLKRWTVIGLGEAVSIDATLGYAGVKSACIKVPAGGVPCGIAQAHDWLTLKPGTKYNLRIWVKSGEERRCDVKFGKLRQTLTAAKGDWQLLHVEGTAAGDEARLEIASAEPGTFWIGTVSLQPADAFHGMRRDVIDCLKRMKPGTLRWPGGCYVEFYRWKEGLLPVDQRPPIGPSGQWWLLPGNDDFDPHEIGIDEFIALCREVGSEPAITVRMSEVAPEEAAGLVEYCNGGTNTKWGKKRAENGHSEPYGVKYWFLGNELDMFGRGGLNNAATCAERMREFAQAMKQVDPAIRRIGCTRVKEAWDKTLLERAGDSFELCSVHDYRIGELFSGGSPAGIQALYDKKYTQPEQLASILRWAREGLPPLFKKVRAPITFDEWNIHWSLHGSVGMGLYTATVLNLLCREAGPYGIESAYFFMPVNEGAIQVTPVAAEMDAAGLVFEMFGGHQGNLLVVPPAADTILDLCASVGAKGDRFWVTAINTDLQKEQTLEVTVPEGCRQKEIAVTILVPESLPPSARTFRQDQHVMKVDETHRVSLKIPPCAIVAAGVKQR